MAGRRGSPTLRRRQLGQELRRLREASGATIDQVAERLSCSASKVSRIETGQSGISPAEARTVLAAYGVVGERADTFLEMALEAKQRGWWQLYGQVLTGAFVGLEAAADQIHAYEALVVPGLFQTEEYARAMVQAARPELAGAEVEQRIRVRLTRQSLLTQEDPLTFEVVMDEAVLHRPVGGRQVMRRQLQRLGEVMKLPNVTLRVLAMDAGAHAGMDGAFTILKFREPGHQDLVFAAHAAGGLFLEKEDDLNRYAVIFGLLREGALGTAETAEMIAKLAEEQ